MGKIEKISKEKGLFIKDENDLVRIEARKLNSDITENIMQSQPGHGREIEILNKNAIKSIESISGKAKGKWINPEILKNIGSKREKVIEILNPQETDALGISQSVEGNTLFGKAIPKKKYSVDEGKTFGRQRQILKKGESLYSLQSIKSRIILLEGKNNSPEQLKELSRLKQLQSKGHEFELDAVAFRNKKDASDFYALVESARVTEFAVGSKESIKLKSLLTQFKKQQGFDIDEYLSKNKIESSIELTIDKSIIQKIDSTSLNEVSRKLTLPTQLSKGRTERDELNQNLTPKSEASISNYNHSVIKKPIIQKVRDSSSIRKPVMRKIIDSR